jgi:hypothetical protein
MKKNEEEFIKALVETGLSSSLCESINDIRKAVFESEGDNMLEFKAEDGNGLTNGIYFHGELQEMFGTDLCFCLDGYDAIPSGAFKGPVRVRGCDEPCTLYKWNAGGSYLQLPAFARMRGLIVMDSDENAVEDAERKFGNKVKDL